MMLPRNRGVGHNSRKRLTDTHALVWMVVLGALAIRAVSRVALLILVVWAAGLALPVDAVRRRSLVAAATIAGVCLLEHGLTFDISLPARKGDAQWSSPERPTEDCLVRRPRDRPRLAAEVEAWSAMEGARLARQVAEGRHEFS